MAEGTGIKKEFVIDSRDSARPAATLDSDTRFYAQGLKPKVRHVTNVIWERTGEIAQARNGKPVELILKTTEYDDGTTVDTTVGEENEAYQSYLKTGEAIASGKPTTTRVRRPSAPSPKAAPKKKAAEKTED